MSHEPGRVLILEILLAAAEADIFNREKWHTEEERNWNARE
jgi:hypothetical protein